MSGFQSGSAAVSALPSAVGVADGRDRPPELYAYFASQQTIAASASAKFEQGEQAGVLEPGHALRAGDLLGDRVPVAGRGERARRRRPRTGRSASGRRCASMLSPPPSAFHLVERRRRTAALVRAGGAAGTELAPGRRSRTAMTSPQPGNRAGALAGGVGCQSPGPVPGVYAGLAADPSLAPGGQDRVGDSDSPRHPVRLRRSIGDVGKRRRQERVERGHLIGEESDKGRIRRLSGSGRQRRPDRRGGRARYPW